MLSANGAADARCASAPASRGHGFSLDRIRHGSGITASVLPANPDFMQRDINANPDSGLWGEIASPGIQGRPGKVLQERFLAACRSNSARDGRAHRPPGQARYRNSRDRLGRNAPPDWRLGGLVAVRTRSGGPCQVPIGKSGERDGAADGGASGGGPEPLAAPAVDTLPDTRNMANPPRAPGPIPSTASSPARPLTGPARHSPPRLRPSGTAARRDRAWFRTVKPSSPPDAGERRQLHPLKVNLSCKQRICPSYPHNIQRHIIRNGWDAMPACRAVRASSGMGARRHR